MIPLPTVFGASGLFYALVVPVLVVQMVALAFIPSLLSPGARVREVGRAIYCYALMSVGILLMTVSGVPALYGILTNAELGSSIYLALILIFSIGGLTYLVYEHTSHALDEASSMVPHALYFYTLKFIGALMVILSTLSLSFTMLFSSASSIRPDFWVTPLIFMMYGIIVSACTTWPRQAHRTFHKNSMSKPPSPAVHPNHKHARIPPKRK